jgi:membrane protease YdiL (CAAX protease family)
LGLRGRAAHDVIIKSIVFLAASYPLVMLAGWLSTLLHTHVFGVEEPELQDAIIIFLETENLLVRGLIIFMACIFAPVVEEIIFRGYLYRVGKRFGGALASAVLTAAFFSVIHGNTPAILPLFVLALALTAAYELYRNLWVPIIMHAIFNTGTLVILLALEMTGNLP